MSLVDEYFFELEDHVCEQCGAILSYEEWENFEGLCRICWEDNYYDFY